MPRWNCRRRSHATLQRLALPLMAEDDRYTIPGSGGVLRNKLGHTTQTGVDGAMNRAATTQWAIVQTEPIPDQLDLD